MNQTPIQMSSILQMNRDFMTTPQTVLCGKYELVVAELSHGENGPELKNPLLAGFAVQFEGDSHYVVRLSMFPGIPYYLSKNRSSQTQFTLFGKLVKDPETYAIHFQNPIGSGKLINETKSHIEIRLPLLGTSVFMNLFSRL